MKTQLDTEITKNCCSCGGKTPIENLYKPGYCDNSFCIACRTFHKAPGTLGHLCENCYSKQTCYAKESTLH